MFGSWKIKIGLSILVGLSVLTIGLGAAPKASAYYNEGNLVDDTIFLDAASMSHGQIQSFLVARGGALANYYSWSGRDNANVSASQIIYEAAYDYGVNPKALLATLQKEQSLVTAKNPTSSQYNFAMGYGCPDSTGCGAAYKGFYAQLDNAAWQLRYNFERARGNNTWWRNSSSYACGGSTRYYSPGLYRGNVVTFYDDSGASYKTFRLNGAASASLYCYTPHAYPGSANQYYSGSYNFVVAFEQWFGSTQPTVVVSSPLRVTTAKQGMYTNSPVTVSFDLTNNANYAMGVGQMTVAVRDVSGNNHDFNLQQMTLPAFGTVTYTSTQSFSTEGDYTFWITQRSQDNVWSDNYPVSANIDNSRRVVSGMLPMPVITAQPTSSVTDLRQGKTTNYSFTVTNSSAQSTINVGKVGLAVRGPNGTNLDLPLHAVSIPASSSYTYTDSFTPPQNGSYTAYVTATTDNGASWNESNYPATGTGVNRQVNFSVKPSPTITQSPLVGTNNTTRVGRSTNVSFKLKNFGDNAVNAGKMGLAIRDPNGYNVDPAAANVNINANSEYTFQTGMTFDIPGTYTAWITSTRDNGATWDDTTYPNVESSNITRRITFTVLPSPTVTVEPTITTVDPRVGKGLTATFTLHNYSDYAAYVGKIALAARDPQGRNVDFALQNVTVPANGDYVYTATNSGETYTRAGVYSAWITVTRDLGHTWDDTTYPTIESNAIHRAISFQLKDSPTLTAGPALSITSPAVGQQVTTSFKVKNFGDSSVSVGRIGLAIRDPQGRNVDPAAVNLTINANSEYTFQANTSFATAGTYTAFVTVTRDNGATWDDTTYPSAESGSIQRKIQFIVQP